MSTLKDEGAIRARRERIAKRSEEIAAYLMGQTTWRTIILTQEEALREWTWCQSQLDALDWVLGDDPLGDVTVRRADLPPEMRPFAITDE